MYKGNKTYLRSVKLEDAKIILKWENNPEFWDITENEGPFSYEDILSFIKQSDNLTESGQQRFMILNLQKEPIGAIDLFGYNNTHKSAGIGILIGEKENRNSGLATDALSTLLLEMKQLKMINELHCIVYTNNIASIKLFKQAGFQESGNETFKGRDVIRFVREL